MFIMSDTSLRGNIEEKHYPHMQDQVTNRVKYIMRDQRLGLQRAL
jgi:hypothetical protein